MTSPKSDTPETTTLSRREVLTGTAKLGLLAATGVAGATACSQTNESKAAGGLPPQGEYLIRGGYILSLDDEIGELDRGDVHVKNGEILAVAAEVSAPGAEVIDAHGMIVMPGFIDTHWHMWHAIFRNFLKEGRSYFPVKYALSDQFMPEDVHNGNRLALAEAINAGYTTVHNFAHNVRSPEYADAELSAWAEFGMRGR